MVPVAATQVTGARVLGRLNTFVCLIFCQFFQLHSVLTPETCSWRFVFAFLCPWGVKASCEPSPSSFLCCSAEVNLLRGTQNFRVQLCTGKMGTGELCCLLAQELVENGTLLNALHDSCSIAAWGPGPGMQAKAFANGDE